MYSTFLTFIIPANKNSYVQSHPKAKRFMTKSFSLFDDLAELCNAVIMMGVGAFRGTGDTSNEQDAGDSVEEEEGYEEWAISIELAGSQDPASSAEMAVSEDWDIDEPMVCLISFTLCWLMKYFQRSVGMTPTFQKSAPRKRQAPETPWSSGRLPDKC